MTAPAGWLLLYALAGILVLWLVLVAPRLLVPAASESTLRAVPDPIKWQALDSRLKLQNDARTTLLQGLGGVAVVIGALVAYRQLRTSRRQLEVTRQGQVTERFSHAIEQLGHGNLDVRLGGIYALEQIARDSPQDRAAIAEVLTAFIRGHAPWPPLSYGEPDVEMAIEDLPELQVRAQDVQAALTVLGRRQQALGPAQYLDLAGTDLRRANLSGAQLERADFSGAQLQLANLSGALLTEADLSGALLTKADLSDAILREADLGDAQLQEANLLGAELQGADLVCSRLQGANLIGAQLVGADLTYAELQGADLAYARLQHAYLVHADLRDTNLLHACL